MPSYSGTGYSWYVPSSAFVPRKTCRIASAMRIRSFRKSQQFSQILGDLWAPHILTEHTILLLTHHSVDGFQGIFRLGEIQPGMSTTTFLAVDGRADNRLADHKHGAQVNGVVPARLVVTRALHLDVLGGRLEPFPHFYATLLFFFCAHNAGMVFHAPLDILHHGIRVFRATLFKRRHQILGRGFNLLRVNIRDLQETPRVLGRRRPSPLAKHQQIAERVASEAIRAMHAPRHLTGSIQARDTGCCGFGIYPHSTHDIVASWANFHGLLGDIEIAKLLELVVHARELAPDGFRIALVGDIQKHAAVRTTPTSEHLSPDSPCHDI